MIAKELITDEIPPLKLSDSGVKALKWMDEFKVSHLPVVDNVKYLGLISDANILDMTAPDRPIGENRMSISRPFSLEGQHIYEVMKMIADLNLTIVPILDAEEHYLGSTTLPHLMSLITGIASINDPGGIIVLELNHNDYSLTEIAQIVESNEAKILSSYITSAPDSTKMLITLKINKKDMSAILQTFNRYDYIISASFQESVYEDDLRSRYDSLMSYLNM